jgi:hypothetical protein
MVMAGIWTYLHPQVRSLHFKGSAEELVVGHDFIRQAAWQ